MNLRSAHFEKALCGIFLLLMCSLGFANDEPVPGSTLLTQLPEGSRIVAKARISSRNVVLYGKYSKLISPPKPEGNSWSMSAGVALPFVRSELSEASLTLFSVNGWAVVFSRSDGELPKTVADFNKLVGSHLQILYDDLSYDPYPGMDKGAVADILMGKITDALKANRHAKAVPEFARLEKLGLSLPESFYYYYIEALDKAGRSPEARVRATAYLKSYGKQGKYYANIIEFMRR